MNQPSIFVEQALVLNLESLAAEQYVIRLEAPECAASVAPGNFIHLQCDQTPYALKRPFSVMRSNAEAGWIEILFKVVGSGSSALAKAHVGDRLQAMGPIGNGFELSSKDAIPLLVGGGVGIPPIVFFAEELKKAHDKTAMVVMGSEIPFPFDLQSSQHSLAGIADAVDSAMSLLEDINVPSRLSSKQGYAGCFNGYVHELAEQWLSGIDNAEHTRVEVFACGPTPMLQAVAEFCQRHQLRCQLSLEEHMACAVGGCAGCNVLITEDGQQSMRRVCVDGPIFDANLVYPPT